MSLKKHRTTMMMRTLVSSQRWVGCRTTELNTQDLRLDPVKCKQVSRREGVSLSSSGGVTVIRKVALLSSEW